ncbi:MAG: glycosyltransferase family 2 protein [archaeon]
MTPPKVLVGTPTFDFHSYCLDEYGEAIKNLSYSNYDILLVDNSKEEGFYGELLKRDIPAVRMGWFEKSRDRVVEGHNILRKKVLDEGYDYLFLLDSDTIPPRDVIERLLSHGKKVVSGMYYQPRTINGERLFIPVIRLGIPGNKDQWSIPPRELWDCGKLIRVVCSGTGCLLIHRDILKDFKFWYNPKGKGTDDIFFFKSLLDADVECYCDTGVVCRHLLSGKPYNWEVEDAKKGLY